MATLTIFPDIAAAIAPSAHKKFTTVYELNIPQAGPLLDRVPRRYSRAE
jgi:hypothetical protein